MQENKKRKIDRMKRKRQEKSDEMKEKVAGDITREKEGYLNKGKRKKSNNREKREREAGKI